MSTETPDLLRLLSAGPAGVGAASRVRGATPQSGAAQQTGIEAAEFADLLERARNGELTSGVPVTIDKDAGVSLSETDLARLTVAADKAEAAGIRTALVMAGDQALVMDVATRTITGKAQMTDGIAAGVDGVIRLDGAGVAEVAPTLAVPQSRFLSNPSLSALLADRPAKG